MSNNVYDYLGIKEKINHGDKVEYLTMLDIQYRMHNSISDIVSSLFYGNKLKCHSTDSIKNKSLEFINTDTSFYYNDSYYSVILRSYYHPISLPIVKLLFDSLTRKSHSLMLLTPYRAQQNILSYLVIDSKAQNSRALTIHRSQGSEANSVILDLTTHSFTSKKEYSKILSSSVTNNLINVAISRAKDNLYIIGSLNMMSNLAQKIPLWKNLLQIISKQFETISIDSYLNNLPRFNPLLSNEKTILSIDKNGSKSYLQIFKESKAEKKFYFMPESMMNLDTSTYLGITFRRIPENSVPEIVIWGDQIAINNKNGYIELKSMMLAEALRRIMVGHLVDTEEANRSNTFILNCEHCGENLDIIFDKIRLCFILLCSKCHRIKFINQNIANDLKMIYKIKCPNCLADMKPRKKIGSRSYSFFGCSNYPRCKGIIPFISLITK